MKFTLFRTIKNIAKDLMVYKHKFDKERYIKRTIFKSENCCTEK